MPCPFVESVSILLDRLEEETDDLAEPAALTFELLCSAQDVLIYRLGWVCVECGEIEVAESCDLKHVKG